MARIIKEEEYEAKRNEFTMWALDSRRSVPAYHVQPPSSTALQGHLCGSTSHLLHRVVAHHYLLVGLQKTDGVLR